MAEAFQFGVRVVISLQSLNRRHRSHLECYSALEVFLRTVNPLSWSRMFQKHHNVCTLYL